MGVCCHLPFLPGTSLEPAVIPTAQASSFTLRYFPCYVWCSKYSCLCSESIECFPGTASKFFLKLLITIPLAPVITGVIVHFRFRIHCISLHKLLYFNFFSAPFCTTFIIIIIITITIIITFILRNTFGQKDSWRSPTTIASGTLRDAVHRIYQDVLYVQNAVRFYDTRLKVS